MDMLIQVLGTGCTKCKTLYELVKKAVAETGVDAVVEKVEDIQQIMAFELIMTPGLSSTARSRPPAGCRARRKSNG
jgi:small redox-active disulfide protein 2